jgi:D-proline reductase (dithiol) PrdB
MSQEPAPPNQESFTEFKNSFAYGSRSDLSFKFLKNLSDADADLFFQELLRRLTDTFDDRDLDRLLDHVYEWQARAYAGAGRWTYADGPFTQLSKPVAASRVALLTSSGHFVDGDDPKPFGVAGMTQAEAEARIDDFLKEEPALSAIPTATPAAELRVRHGGYDVRSAQADPNVAFPIDRLRELAREGRIGELAPEAYSFVGACAQTPLLKRTGPQWVDLLHARSVDAAVLVPI